MKGLLPRGASVWLLLLAAAALGGLAVGARRPMSGPTGDPGGPAGAEGAAVAAVAARAPTASVSTPVEVNALVHAWRDAWQTRDIGRLGTFYGDAFLATAPGGKLWHKAEWLADKAAKFARTGDFRVELGEVSVDASDPGRPTARFLQVYIAGGYSDRGIKTLTLTRGPDGRLLIVSEMFSAESKAGE